jgi:hypothetical protein
MVSTERVVALPEGSYPMKRLHRLLATLLMLCFATAARAFDAAPVSDPEALGFSSSRLARIAAWQQTQVDAGAFSGSVAAIARNGKVGYLRAVGFRDRAKTMPLAPDAIFWIAGYGPSRPRSKPRHVRSWRKLTRHPRPRPSSGNGLPPPWGRPWKRPCVAFNYPHPPGLVPGQATLAWRAVSSFLRCGRNRPTV